MEDEMVVGVRIVEDSVTLAEMLHAILSLDGIPSVCTTNNFQNLLSPEPWKGITAVLCDLDLACAITGEDILKYLTEHHPQIRRIVLSAVWDAREHDYHLIETGLAHMILQKPSGLDQIVAAVRPHV